MPDPNPSERLAGGGAMKGTRVENVDQLLRDGGVDGGYCPDVRDGQRTWMVLTPNGHLGNLGNHEVEEHEDGTITVSPSIHIWNPQEGVLYHGFLRRGEWSVP